ncbi:bifunctional 5,10-methylenetetrahydrofolate dehydrogenase/5,10-methenyltetrahydrofolate cyclohydrolase [Candidatus Saccharibacteria bacterium]|nr:bifunctional 5,10-methylenetetrahydrofolate dehydrogenase/5,10-methenyltetrahydrofolate cyclohydrolase [Candidatus Saccharibacteria bacterium]
MKILSGRELAGFIKERQAHQVASLEKKPKLLILRDNNDPVIQKYVNLKKAYAKDLGIITEDFYTNSIEEIATRIKKANEDKNVNGIIIQLPLIHQKDTETLCNLISPTKDVDGLGEHAAYDSATATAINWLLTGFDINLNNQKIAIVGRGKLVGAPLYRIFKSSNLNVNLFHRGSDLTKLKQYDIIITATGVPGLIVDSMVKPGASIVDAGTASENGVLKGDIDAKVRERNDLNAITPTLGGVGPLTISCLFDHVIESAIRSQQ